MKKKMQYRYFIALEAFGKNEREISITECYALRNGETGLLNRLNAGDILPIINFDLAQYDFGFSDGVIWAEEK